MSDNSLPPTTKTGDKPAFANMEEAVKHRNEVFSNLVEKLKPWLFEFGNWLFGGLIGFNLIIVAPLLTVGLIHPAITLSIAIFVCALPLNVSGLFALKLIKDMSGVSIEEVMQQAFQDAHVTSITSMRTSEENAARNKKRTDFGLRYTVRLAVLSATLTILGMVTALWYVGWWVSLIFIVMVIISVVMTVSVITRLMRPDDEADRELIRRYREQRVFPKNGQPNGEQ